MKEYRAAFWIALCAAVLFAGMSRYLVAQVHRAETACAAVAVMSGKSASDAEATCK